MELRFWTGSTGSGEPSALRGVLFLIRHRPRFVIMQWWTGAVLHSWLLLAIVARLIRAQLVIEFHEVQDVGEQVLPLAGGYVNLGLPLLLRLSSAAVVHSDFDRIAIEKRYGTLSGEVVRIPHGPYTLPLRSVVAPTPKSPCRLLFFGVIRPFKGLDDLVHAFNSLVSPGNRQAAPYCDRRDLGGIHSAQPADRGQPISRPDHFRKPLCHR